MMARGSRFPGGSREAEMDEIGKGPMIIKERVHLIAGKLTVESNPGQGARLEIIVPRDAEVPNEF